MLHPAPVTVPYTREHWSFFTGCSPDHHDPVEDTDEVGMRRISRFRNLRRDCPRSAGMTNKFREVLGKSPIKGDDKGSSLENQPNRNADFVNGALKVTGFASYCCSEIYSHPLGKYVFEDRQYCIVS